MRKWKRILFFLLIIQFVNLSMNSVDAQAENSETHKVQKGETAWRIAKNYGITIADLKEWNDMESDTVYVGQIIKVENPILTAKQLPQTGPVILEDQMEYIVQPGETLWRIATR
ncbi:LysM peptidoglycan-binding domain-containing protein, partial [Carnobacterium sp.]